MEMTVLVHVSEFLFLSVGQCVQTHMFVRRMTILKTNVFNV